MNIQAMMKQAQKLQKEMKEAQDEINKTIFEGKSSFVLAKVNGDRTIVSIEIQKETMDKDDIEMLQDMIVVAINDAMHQIDVETERKLGKFTQGIPGLF